MKHNKAWIFSIALIVLPASIALADPTPQSIDVWPGAAPGLPANPPKEDWQGKRVTNVTHPTLEFFRPPKEQDTGVSVIVCPGGGYRVLMMSYEGEDVAQWLTTIGVTGIVLKYRVPAPPGAENYVPALQDGQRAVSLLRSKASELRLKPDRIGMLGFSAGGHLTIATSTNFDQRTYDSIDDVDRVSCRPDFQVLIYPGGGLVEKESGKLRPEIRVSAQTPQAFLAMATDDPVNSENCVFYYVALKRAGIPAEMHLYATGGHGFGIRPSDKPCATWPQRMSEWMRSQGILPHEPAAATEKKTP